MAGRPIKEGLDYFSLDCHMDDKVKLIQAEFGLKGFAVVIKLLQKIYGEHGYYCEWNDDTLLLFMSDNLLDNGSKQMIQDVVSACIRRGLFSEEKYRDYGILTSTGIQKRYMVATYERKCKKMRTEYTICAAHDTPLHIVKTGISDTNNSISGTINSNNRTTITQSKVKESKVNKKNNAHQSTDALFEQLWKLYPNKKGKARVSQKAINTVVNIGLDEMTRAIDRYVGELKKETWRQPQNGSTFFNSGYVDYLDANFEPSRAEVKKPFNNFKQRQYDFEALEKEIFSN